MVVPERPDEVAESSVFQLPVITEGKNCYGDGVEIRRGPTSRYHVAYSVLMSPVLEYQYMVPENPLEERIISQYSNICAQLRERLDEAVLFDMLMVPDDELSEEAKLVYDSIQAEELDPRDMDDDVKKKVKRTMCNAKIIPLLQEGGTQWLSNAE